MEKEDVLDLENKMFEFRIMQSITVSDRFGHLNRTVNDANSEVNNIIDNAVNELVISSKAAKRSISDALNEDKFKKKIYSDTIETIIRLHSKYPHDLKNSSWEIDFKFKPDISWNVKYHIKTEKRICICAAPDSGNLITIYHVGEISKEVIKSSINVKQISDFKLLQKSKR